MAKALNTYEAGEIRGGCWRPGQRSVSGMKPGFKFPKAPLLTTERPNICSIKPPYILPAAERPKVVLAAKLTMLDQPRAGLPPAPHTSTFAYFALASMKARRGGTSSPMSMEKMRSASRASSIETCWRMRVVGSMVVSQSCSAFISPKPL
jgi:hypothetical protein